MSLASHKKRSIIEFQRNFGAHIGLKTKRNEPNSLIPKSALSGASKETNLGNFKTLTKIHSRKILKRKIVYHLVSLIN